MSIILVPADGFIEREVFHKNFITENKTFWNRIPIHADTCKCYVTASESSWPRNKY